MNPLNRAVAIGCLIACVVVAAGLVTRRRWALSGFFSAYIAFCIATTPMYVWWPAQFYHQWFYLVIQTGLDVLKFGIVMEVVWRTFRPFPGARSSVLPVALALVAITATAAAAVPVEPDAWDWELVTGHFFPRIKAGTIWLMAATLVLARWYHLPVHPFHAALLASFVAYLGVATTLSWLTQFPEMATHPSLIDALGRSGVDCDGRLLGGASVAPGRRPSPRPSCDIEAVCGSRLRPIEIGSVTPLHQACAITNLLLCVAIIAGLIVRRRWRLCLFLDLYVAVVLVVVPLIVGWPYQFNRQWFYLLFNTVANVFKFGIALEVGWKTFQPFARARSMMLLAALGILIVTAVAANAAPMDSDLWVWEDVAGKLWPRVKTGTLWLMAAMLMLARWYHVPVHPFHSAVLTSWVAYLGFTSAYLWMQAQGIGEATFGTNRGLIDDFPVVPEILLPAYWTYMAWRPDSASVVAHDATVRRLRMANLVAETAS